MREFRTRRDARRGSYVALQGLHHLHVLVKCAGTIGRRDEYNLDTFQQVPNVNVVCSMRTTLAARELLTAEQGCVINAGSMYTFLGSPHAPAYGASKAAISQLTKSMAIAFAPDVRVNAIAQDGFAPTSPQRFKTTTQFPSGSCNGRPLVDGVTPMTSWVQSYTSHRPGPICHRRHHPRRR
jgi:NAD(P)-dependent dehydrogenase (short-subunit alcohol dehydrogenase family)